MKVKEKKNNKAEQKRKFCNKVASCICGKPLLFQTTGDVGAGGGAVPGRDGPEGGDNSGETGQDEGACPLSEGTQRV